MRAFLYTILFLFISDAMYAQDTLYKTDGSKHLVKIIEVNETQVKYNPDGNTDAYTFVISKDLVHKIVYASGKTEIFQAQNAATINSGQPTASFSRDLSRNFISINVFDLMYNSLTFAFERTLKRGDFSLKIPVSIGLATIGIINNSPRNYYSDNHSYYNRSKIFSTGIDFYFYPYSQGKTRYFAGPSIEYGHFNTRITNFDAGNTSKVFRGTFHGFIIQNGFLFRPSAHFNIATSLGLGYVRSEVKFNFPTNRYGELYHDYGMVLRAGVNLGIKF